MTDAAALFGKKTSWEKRKILCMVFMATMLCMAVILIAFSVPSIVRAEKDVTGTIKDAALTSENATNGMAKLFSDKMDGTHFTSTFDDFFSGSSVYMGKIKSIGFGHTFWTGIRWIASGLATIAVILHILDVLPDFPENPERIAAPFILYIATMAVITNTDTFAAALTAIGESVMNAVKGWQSSQFSSFECTDIAALMGQMYGPGFKVTAQILVGLQTLLLGVGLTLIMYIVDFGIYTLCFSVLFELVVYDAFLPLGVCWFPLSGFRGGTLRYLKSYAGIWIKIASFYAVAAVSGTLMSVTVQDGKVTLTECFYIVAIALSVPRMLRSAHGFINAVLAN